RGSRRPVRTNAQDAVTRMPSSERPWPLLAPDVLVAGGSLGTRGRLGEGGLLAGELSADAAPVTAALIVGTAGTKPDGAIIAGLAAGARETTGITARTPVACALRWIARMPSSLIVGIRVAAMSG